MKKIKKILVVFLCLLSCLSGCGREDEEEVVAIPLGNKGEYSIVTPFKASDARQTHIQFNRSSYDIDAVGEGLLRYAKEYFEPSKYYLQEGQLLSRNTLQAGLIYGDKEGLLGSKSKNNPYGLNPEDGMKMPAEDGVTITAKAGGGGTIPVIDVFEVNFVSDLKKDAEIKGIALAIVLNPHVLDASGKEHVISDKNLKTYGEEAGRNLVAYIKKQPGISARIPIMVSLFKAESSDDSLPGTYIASGYGRGNVDKFNDINEKWVIFPSAAAESANSTLLAQFNGIKTELYDFLPNNTEIIGKGFFVDDRITKLQINVIMQAKTYVEKLGVTQYTKELLSQFNNTDMEITVRIEVDGETFAMITRESGSDDCDVMIR